MCQLKRVGRSNPGNPLSYPLKTVLTREVGPCEIVREDKRRSDQTAEMIHFLVSTFTIDYLRPFIHCMAVVFARTAVWGKVSISCLCPTVTATYCRSSACGCFLKVRNTLEACSWSGMDPFGFSWQLPSTAQSRPVAFRHICGPSMSKIQYIRLPSSGCCQLLGRPVILLLSDDIRTQIVRYRERYIHRR